MYQIDVMSRKPVYEQLVDQVERFILRGVLKPEQQMQSVRSLSVDLAVNPNTVQKAYSELDRRGVVYSVPGRGGFISPGAIEKIGIRKRGEMQVLADVIEEMALAGIPLEEVISCVENVYRAAEDRRRHI